MLIKENILRRIIREEARRVMREAAATPNLSPAAPGATIDQWKGLSQGAANIAGNLSVLAPGGSKQAIAVLKDLIAKGNKSQYAGLVGGSRPATVTNGPTIANGEVAKLICMLASMSAGKAITDYLSAQQILTGKASQTDFLSQNFITKILNGDANSATSRMNDLMKLATSQNPSYVEQGQKPMATDPGAGTFLDMNLSGNAPVNVKAGSMSYTLPGNTVSEMAKSMAPIARGQKVLKLGAQGPDVMTLQQLLSTIAQQTSAFAAPTSTGKYDAPTAAAVKAYQAAAGIVADGAVGQQTLAQIIGRNSSMTGQAGDKGNYLRGAQSAAGTQPMGGAGVNPNLAAAQRPTQK